MWWECSECGGHVEGERPPLVCGECGLAGVIFEPLETDEPFDGDSDAGSMRAAWLRAGMEWAQPALEA